MRAETHAPQWSYWTVVDFVFRPPPTRELYPRKPDSRYKVGVLSAYARRRPGGGNGLPRFYFIRILRDVGPLPPPGSPLRWRARGSPTSPQGGGKFWKSQGRSINLIAIHATCDCPA